MKEELLYTEDFLWVRVEGKIITVGLTPYMQAELGTIISVVLPEIDDAVEKGEPCAEVSGSRDSMEMLSPATGRITEINVDLKDNPALVSDDPLGDGWLFQIHARDTRDISSLLTQDEFTSRIADRD